MLNSDHAGGGGKAEQVRKLDFWLTRVQALFAQAGKPPPPIIINYLWGINYGYRLRHGTLKNVDHNPLQYTGALIDSYRRLGWEIAVMNVGAAVNTEAVLAQPDLLFDDGSHPSCSGTHFIADMLAHLFYSNLASQCPAVDHANEAPNVDRPSHDSMVPIHNQIAPNTTTQKVDGLWEDLFRSDAVVGSLTAWEPQLGNTSILRVHNPQDVLGWERQNQGKAVPAREDRKIAYSIPQCQDDNGQSQQLSLTLLEPGLAWLGLGQQGTIEVRINSIPIPFKKIAGWCLCAPYVKQWIHVLDHVQKADNYVVSLCHNGKPKDQSNLGFLVGVSLPDDSSSGSIIRTSTS